MGGDRRLVLSSAILAVILIFVLQRWWSIPLGVGLWMGMRALAKRLGKADAYMLEVYSLHRKYKGFYPAKSGLRYRPASRLRADWKPKILG